MAEKYRSRSVAWSKGFTSEPDRLETTAIRVVRCWRRSNVSRTPSYRTSGMLFLPIARTNLVLLTP